MSLNTVLLSGLRFVNDLTSGLLSFPKNAVEIVAYIEHVFYKFLVTEDHCNCSGTCWFRNNDPNDTLIEWKFRYSGIHRPRLSYETTVLLQYPLHRIIDHWPNNLKSSMKLWVNLLRCYLGGKYMSDMLFSAFSLLNSNIQWNNDSMKKFAWSNKCNMHVVYKYKPCVVLSHTYFSSAMY